MKTVTLTSDLRPFRAGDDIHVEDDVARALIAAGEAQNMRPFNDAAENRMMQAGASRRGYRTKGEAA